MNIAATISELNLKLDALEANPKLKEQERHKEYYAYSSVHGGNLLKEHALMVCAAVDEDAPEYQTLVLPLIKRIEAFFAHPDHQLDFADEIRILRARRLIEQGKYQQADQVYKHIPYSPIYATAFDQRNHYFLNAGKNHLHLLKRLTHPAHIKHQLICALHALQYVHEYPYSDDIALYQNAAAIFAHNYYDEAKVKVSTICKDLLPESLNSLNQRETLMVYKTLLPYKHTLTEWRTVVKTLQKHFIELSFVQQQFQPPEEGLLREAHALLDEPTSTFGQLQHIIGKTSLEKDFLNALVGSNLAVQHLQKFAQK
jgi:hypothetical protein